MTQHKVAYFNAWRKIADTAVQRWLHSYEHDRLWLVGWLPRAELDDPIDIDWESSGFLTSGQAMRHAKALAQQMPDYAFVIYKDTEEPLWIMAPGPHAIDAADAQSKGKT